jgi:hypothetical protein
VHLLLLSCGRATLRVIVVKKQYDELGTAATLYRQRLEMFNVCPEGCCVVSHFPADAHPFSYMIDMEQEWRRFDPQGAYVRRWLPVLSQLPSEFIHQPWKAPPEVLEEAGAMHVYVVTAVVCAVLRVCFVARGCAEPAAQRVHPPALEGATRSAGGGRCAACVICWWDCSVNYSKQCGASCLMCTSPGRRHQRCWRRQVRHIRML